MEGLDRTALVLAAHGSSHRPEAADGVRRMAESIRELGEFGEVVAAFIKDRPALREVLDALSAEEIVVVPVFTSSGHFTRKVLPRELGLTDGGGRVDRGAVCITRPVGEHPAIRDFLLREVREAVARNGLDPEDTAVVLVGHGTRRNPASAAATLDHAEALRASGLVREVVSVFLDQPPEIEEVYTITLKSNLVVLPYLIGGAGHERDDIPARLGIDRGGAVSHPQPPDRQNPQRAPDRVEGGLGIGDCRMGNGQNPYRIHERLVYLLPALGDAPGLVDAILDLARSAVGAKDTILERSFHA